VIMTVVTAVVGFFGALGGSWFGTKLSEKAKRKALFDDLTNHLETRFAESERTKAGELAAVHNDLKNLVSQTAQITLVQSQIQAEINGDLWIRQMVWHQKRDAYFNILKALRDFRSCLIELSASRMVYWELELKDPNGSKAVFERMTNAFGECVTSRDNFQHTLIEAKVFSDTSLSAVLDECLFANLGDETIGQWGLDPFVRLTEAEKKDLNEKGSREKDVLGEWMYQMLRSARRDLGVDPLSQVI
jgi:hypothetical protein